MCLSSSGHGDSLTFLAVRQRHIIPDAQLVEQETRLRRIGFQLAAQVADEGTQVRVFAAVVRPPHALQQFAMRQHFAGVARQLAEQFVFGGSEVNLFAA